MKAPLLATLLALSPCALAAQGTPTPIPFVQVVAGSDGSRVSIDPGSVTRSGDSSFVLTSEVRFPAAVGERHQADRELDTEELDAPRRAAPAASPGRFSAATAS